MKETPILYSPPMAKARLEGLKTQTRRIIKPQPNFDMSTAIHRDNLSALKENIKRRCRYGKPGDYIVIKEAHYMYGSWDQTGTTKTGRPRHEFVPFHREVRYYDNPPKEILTGMTGNLGWYKRNSLFMPKWASRFKDKIVDIRVERVQDVDGDAIFAEGVDNGKSNKAMGIRWENMQKLAFAELWDSINLVRGYGWDANPYIFVIETEY